MKYFFVFFLIFCVYSDLDINSPWPTYRGNQDRTGKSSYSIIVSNTPSLKWQHSLDRGEGRWSTNVAIDQNDNVFICGLGNKPSTYQFYCYNNKGIKVWEYSHHAEYHNPGFCSNPILGTNNDIYWTIPADSTFSFNRDTGDILWTRQGPNALFNVDSVIRGDTFYGFNYAAKPKKKTFHGLNTTTGVTNYNSSLFSTIGGQISMTLNETLFMSGCGFALATTFDAVNFYKTIIPYGCISHLSINSTTYSSFAIASFVRTDFGTKVYSFSFDGTIEWVYYLTLLTTLDRTTVGIQNGYVYAAAPNILVALEQNTGNLIWQANIPNNNNSIVYDVSSPVFDASGGLFVVVSNSVSQHSSIWGFNPTNGEKIFESDSFSCSTLDVGVSLGIGALNSFVVVCSDSTFYFAP